MIQVHAVSALPRGADGSAIRTQLDRIQASADFDVPDRARKFLSYIVEETLGGRADRIKAYSIALEVFGRDGSFDPQADPVVRIEAGRIRRALERYYLTAGRSDEIVITIPKGAYVPVFEPNVSSAEAVAHSPATAPGPEAPLPTIVAPRWKWGRINRSNRIGMLGAGLCLAAVPVAFTVVDWAVAPPPPPVVEALSSPDIPRLLIEPFEDLSATDTSSIITRGLSAEIIGQIARFKDLVVIDGARLGVADVEPGARSKSPARYILGGSVRISADEIRLTTALRSAESGTILWAQNFTADLKVKELLSLESEIARDVATALAQPYGVIFQADASQVSETPPEDWEAYVCTLAYFTYRTDLNPEIHAFVRGCLERAVAQYPSFATAWALLSITYLDEFRFRYLLAPAASPPLAVALDYARRAVELDAQNVRGQQAYMMALYLNQEIESALKVGEGALALNPNDAELRAEYGIRMAQAGHWEEGEALIQEALLRSRAPQGYYEAVIALCAYMRRDYQTAALWIRKSDVQANPLFHLIAAAIYGRLGDSIASQRETDWLVTNARGIVDNIHEEVALRIARPEDQLFIIEGLGLAGVPIPAS